MTRTILAPVALLTLLAACGAPPTPQGETETLTEQLMALVAPGQDMSNVRIESDGCYWYRYVGPVEVTYLPLLTRDGRMICTRPQ
ncbi:hypothetical protein N8I71_13135 [Roseibacterium sp. SDUM158016]|jgi:hypothetical protein|uniref:hypothetical protein n=1 Tax=Roseicyclus sediminis TaxID=2980997 RepID=UPI0021CE8668|nr:hypothetical protein [Roseibacterium sp. SDUM158016]MCU4653782.1 hypothetical protein [Roseibacterium sp. SDUM158016]